MTRVGAVCLVLFLLLPVNGADSGVTPARVLILNPFERDVAPFNAVVSAFRSTLTREMQGAVDFYEVPLDLARNRDPGGEAALVDFIEGRIANRGVDLVVTIGGPGVQFSVRHRPRLFPNIPLLAVAPDPRMLPPDLVETNATFVTQRVDLPGIVEDILQLQPDTTNIVVVFGASPLERFWVSECRREFQSFSNRVQFTWLTDLPLDQVLQRCAVLPPRSFILHGLFLTDVNGVACEKSEALRRLHGVANAPLFSYFGSEFGLGQVGGRLYQDTEVGARGALTAVRLLAGERAETIPPQILQPGPPIYDWRELRRWRLDESRLPEGSVIEFRQAGFWELYRWPILGAVLFCAVGSALIIGLLVTRARRRQGETEATLIAEISSKFVNLPAAEVDREIVNAERRICELLGLDVSGLWQWSDAAPGSFRLTHLFGEVKAPIPERMDATEYFPWLQQQMLAGRIVACASLEELPPEAGRDREAFRQFGIRSNLTIPLSVGGQAPIGALGLNTTRARREWPETLVSRLRLVAQIFANALARRRADQILRESELRLSLTADFAEAGLWVLDCATQVFWASERARTLFDYHADEVVSLERFRRSVHAEDWETVQRNLECSMRAGEPVNVEYRIRLNDGRVRWIASRGRSFFKTNGDPERLLGLSMDITERKQFEAALRASEELNRVIFEQAAVGIAHVGIDGRWLLANDRLCDIVRYPREELLQLTFQDITYPEDLEKDLGYIRKTLAGEITSYTLKKRYIRRDGSPVWVILTVSLVRKATGGPAHFISLVEDITEQQRAEMEAQELRSNLAHAGRVTVLGQLASALAHELSQPLGAILRNAETAEILLREASPDLEELRAIVTDIRQDDRRAGDVIDRLRSLLKRRSLELQTIDLPGVIAEVMSLVHSDATARQVKLAHSIAPGLPPVRGDRIHLQQVLLNLLINAMDGLDDRDSGERRIQVSVQPTNSGTVEIRVCDNGPGIPIGSLEHLFEPFFTTKAKGMGMGLPVSRTIIEAHRGKLWAENRSDGGACFCFTIPILGSEGQMTKPR